jgi:hypothetical protein
MEKTIVRNSIHIGYEFADTPRIEWEKGLKLDNIDTYDSAHMIFGYDQNGCYWKAVGCYSCGELVSVEDIEKA